MNLAFLDRLSVLVVGDLMLDHYLFGSVERISPEAPVPIINIRNQQSNLGGAANVAANLADLGVKTEIIGSIGNDSDGSELLRHFVSKGIQFNRCIKSSNLVTTKKTRVIAQGQQICRIDTDGHIKNESVLQGEINSNVLDAVDCHDVVIISDYAKGVVSQSLLDALAKYTKRKTKFLALDPKPKRPLNISGMDLITPNLKEAKQLIGDHECAQLSVLQITQKIHHAFSPRFTAITLSENGISMLCPDGTYLESPAQAKEITDVSGAGDTVIALLSTALANQMQYQQALNLANAGAAIVVKKPGTQSASRQELLKVLKKQGDSLIKKQRLQHG